MIKKKAGQCFRYAKVDDMYKWVLVEDAEVTKAIATATEAQRTADGKATIYTTSSTPIGAPRRRPLDKIKKMMVF